jgi:tetratricopeptide (TPR) repeat protein
MKTTSFTAAVSIALLNLLSIMPMTSPSLLVAPAAAQVPTFAPLPPSNRWRMPDYLLPYLYPPTDIIGRPTQLVAQTVRQRLAEANNLIEQGEQQQNSNQFQEAFQSLQQALAISREAQVRAEQPSLSKQVEAYATLNLGALCINLKAPQQAVEYLQRALPLLQELDDRNNEAIILMNLSSAYRQLGQPEKTIEYAEQALSIFQEVNDRQRYAMTLGSLGNGYAALGQYQESSEYYQQALPILQAEGARKDEAIVLLNLGSVYEKLSGYDRSIAYYRQALPIVRELGDRDTESFLLANIGRLYIHNDSPQSAIQFLQQSVEVRESLRDQMQQLPQNVQQAYVTSITPDYRLLADLLKQQNRQTEAQQILDFLK